MVDLSLAFRNRSAGIAGASCCRRRTPRPRGHRPLGFIWPIVAAFSDCVRRLESKHPPKGEQEYWIKANMAEAYVGIGDDAKAQELLEAARAVNMSVPSLDSSSATAPPVAPSAVPGWMIQTAED